MLKNSDKTFIQAIKSVGLEDKGIANHIDLHDYLIGTLVLSGDLSGKFRKQLFEAGLIDSDGNVVSSINDK